MSIRKIHPFSTHSTRSQHLQCWQRRLISIPIVFLICFSIPTPAWAFCGFFTAKAETKLTNTTSRVIIARQGNKSVFTMANNFQGNVKDFARIVPIPVLPNRQQVRIGDNQIIELLDTFTVPRLAEYSLDLDDAWRNEVSAYFRIIIGLPLLVALAWVLWRASLVEKLVILCILALLFSIALPSFLNQAAKMKAPPHPASLVQIADRFTVGEYDVTFLSAAESNALTVWLNANGYKVPKGAETMLQSYIQAGMKFFVVKVNLENLQPTSAGFLRPIVIEYESPKFMLPMRLGTLNASTDQDLTVYILSPDAIAEVANYPTLPVPTDSESKQNGFSGRELPSWIETHFSEFYNAVFQQAYDRAGKSVAFLEYAGVLSPIACDPCSMPFEDANSFIENLPKAGIFWTSKNYSYVTRLHIRYNEKTFPQDLEFRTVSPEKMRSRLKPISKISFPNRRPIFQARYVIRKATGKPKGLSGLRYWWNARQLNPNLSDMTGWSQAEIDRKLKSSRSKLQ